MLTGVVICAREVEDGTSLAVSEGVSLLILNGSHGALKGCQ
jgi:hypothetical protein